jgi:hypothetical protein
MTWDGETLVLQAIRLMALLKTWQQQTNAPCPSEPNPNFDPATIKQGGKNKGNN